ncbi:hypothetical protein GCM10009642_19540 [Nocardiopsis metallicus]
MPPNGRDPSTRGAESGSGPTGEWFLKGFERFRFPLTRFLSSAGKDFLVRCQGCGFSALFRSAAETPGMSTDPPGGTAAPGGTRTHRQQTPRKPLAGALVQ